MHTPTEPLLLPTRLPRVHDRHVVIVGGGFCGTALAIHLLRSPALRVTLLAPTLGRGVAYGTTRPEHRLNVRAAAMSLDPAAPDDFVAFAQARMGDVGPDDLVPRTLYAEYLDDRLASAVAASEGRFVWARSAAREVRRASGGWRVTASDGRAFAADEVVLATGHGPTRAPTVIAALGEHPAIVRDPWAEGALEGVDPEDRVLVIGTGLTAVDVLLTLRARGHVGPVHAVSRHGRWPRPHLPTVRWLGPAPAVWIDEAPVTADGLVGWLAERIAAAGAAGIPWQAVMDAVRPHVATLWARLPTRERVIFLRDHRSRWEGVRHRVAHATWASLEAWRAEGWLVDGAGEVAAVAVRADGLAVTIQDANAAREAVYDRVVSCCGNASDPREFDDPLWRQLLADGLVTPDRHGLGVETDAPGAIAEDGLWALGGLLRPWAFESTAVPDLSRQVAGLASRLAARAVHPLPAVAPVSAQGWR